MNKIWITVISCSLITTELTAQNSLTFADTRAVPTTPASYIKTFAVNFKRADSVQLLGTGGVYVALLGMRAWGDNSGGKSHEIAFAQNSNVYVRSGLDPTWENWRRLISEDVSGNVGIGTTSPKAYLDVGATVANTTTSILGRLPEGNGTGTGTYLGVQAYATLVNGNSFALEHRFYGNLNSAINFYRGSSYTGGFLTFSTGNGAERMRIDGAGNVGIGTTTPGSYKLAVEGAIGARRVKVTQAAWADYVFKPGYCLPGLPEVEQFIRENGHLKDMPSEAKVKQEGIDLGEMNKLLLQKIEELTLYLIENDKKNKALTEQIAQLSKEVTQLKNTVTRK